MCGHKAWLGGPLPGDRESWELLFTAYDLCNCPNEPHMPLMLVWSQLESLGTVWAPCTERPLTPNHKTTHTHTYTHKETLCSLLIEAHAVGKWYTNHGLKGVIDYYFWLAVQNLIIPFRELLTRNSESPKELRINMICVDKRLALKWYGTSAATQMENIT